ncbi:MAG: M48 family metallopeptidase [Candidatus Dadabacteria bacterium]|nr:M48 family metallopeptidase [Candidatus Dadabacteria bacterium]
MVQPKEFKEFVVAWSHKIGVEPKEIHIREMTRKWASCSTKGRLTFATSLLEEPKKKQDEVIVHELLHLRYPNHGKMFHMMLKSYLG